MRAMRRPGVWMFNSWSGALIGLNLQEAMASLSDGIDRALARDLFSVAEIAYVRVVTEEMDKNRSA